MNRSIPTPEEALEILEPISPEIYRAFEHGISKATVYFKSEAIEPRGPLGPFAMFVKLHACANILRKCPEFASVVFDRLSSLWNSASTTKLANSSVRDRADRDQS